MEANVSDLQSWLTDVRYHPCFTLKLPAACHDVQAIKRLAPNLKVIWCVRDPRDVVLSMASLMLPISASKKVAWVNYSQGARREIINCFPVLNSSARSRLLPYVKQYMEIEQLHPEAQNKEHSIFTGALCWEIKNIIPATFTAAGIEYLVVHYEKLICEPKQTLKEILRFMELDWHDDVLMHHRLHRGISIGNTDNTAAINHKNMGKWVTGLSVEQLSIVRSICKGTAKQYHYDL